ncbi:MAG: type II toxin-antitoxin system HicB family antitoxin [Treponema sp.]|jgi:predicted RNase H-like HicB family nuclease|nr:type II toxin-antitoxin system HicB family antitoxin [Treponema sp.]
MAKYIAFIELDREQKTDMLGVVFPDFPGLVSAGNDYDEAFRNAHEALAGHAEVMRENGEKLPVARSLEDIRLGWDGFSDWDGTNYAVAYIDLLPDTAARKYTISMNAGLMARIDARTRNRSAFLASVAERALGGK